MSDSMKQTITALTLADGRVVTVAQAGPVDGPVLVVHHGTPSGRHIARDVLGAALPLGLRVIQHMRPGYPGSTPCPGRSVADDADLLGALLDHLGVDEFVSAGFSGGGPHSLAAAALLPQRCRAAAVVAGVAPYTAEGLDWLAGMGDDNIVEFGAALEGEAAVREHIWAQAQAMRDISGDEVIGALSSLLPEPDRTVINGELAEDFAADLREVSAFGIEGWVEDDIAFTQPWGFDLASIAVPVNIWQGSEDLMVPHAHGVWLAAAVPGARWREAMGEGHLSIMVRQGDEVLGSLLADAGLA